MSEKVRSRGTNFSSHEKELVIKLVTNHKSIIECKKADGVNLKEKEAAWEKIRQEFNSSTHVSSRTTKQLRQFYINLKRNAKKARCEESVEHFNTGGGECKKIKLDESVLSLIQVQEDPLNPHTSDALYYGEVPVEQQDPGEVLTIIQENDDTEFKLEPMEDAILILGEPVAQTSSPKAKASSDKDFSPGASKTKETSCERKVSDQSSTAELASSRITVCQEEMLLIKKKYHAELELIELKKETQKLKQKVLRAKLAKLK